RGLPRPCPAVRLAGVHRMAGLAVAVAACLALAPVARAGETPGPAFFEFTGTAGLSTFPDTNTRVYQSAWVANDAVETVIRGRPPAARFWSFALIDNSRKEIAYIADSQVALAPD